MISRAHKMEQRGFTLVELSIVLIIIGFIIAGVAAGQSLIKQAQIRSVISEANTYFIAVNNFKMKYAALPGDMRNASDIWGTNCAATLSNCNGNGDGYIDYGGIAFGFGNETDHNESLRSWQHLTLSGILPGSYSGFTATAGLLERNVNIPASKYPGATYNFRYYAQTGNSLDFYNAIGTSALLTPNEAYEIDTKIDDGLARTGKVWAAGNPSATGCYDAVGSEYKYNLSIVEVTCALHLLLDEARR